MRLTLQVCSVKRYMRRWRERVPKLASLEQMEAMYAQLETALLNIGFLQPQNAGHMMLKLRQLLGRAVLEIPDVGILRGIARQINWHANSGRK
jgi:tRNA/rRNA methyltransferase